MTQLLAASARGVHLTAAATPGEAAVRPLSVLHVVAPSDAGGMESVVRMLAGGLLGRGHAVRVLTLEDAPARPDHPFAAALEGAGVEVVRLALPGRAYLRERAAVAELCRRL